MATLGIDRDFLRDFATLERPVQDKVFEVFSKFEQAAHAGLHLEKLHKGDARVRTVRIDLSYRGVVLAPAKGDQFTLLKVLPHDDAYAWAERHHFTVNKATGGIEVRDITAIDETTAELAETTTTPRPPIFAHVNDADMARLGIDTQVLAFARVITDPAQLTAARGILPATQYDVLTGLAIGMTTDDVWQEMASEILATPEEIDPEDLDAAVDRSRHRIATVTGPDELLDLLAMPLDAWRIYLHPTQHRAAYGDYAGSARVTGGPGTGKTVAALHRATALAAGSSEDRSVLLTTFTRTLAESLARSLDLLTNDDRLLRRVDVRHVDQLANQIVSQKYGHLGILSDVEEQDRWNTQISAHRLDTTPAFLGREWRNVVLAQGVTDVDGYLAAQRAGRGIRLAAAQREQLWPALSGFAQVLRDQRRWTHETVCVEAARLLEAAEAKPYRHVIVDEAQDLSPWQWRLLRAAVPNGPNDLFIAGDTHQRIYEHRVSLRALGIAVSGRSTRLTLNYRTTAEILAWSLGVLHAQPVDDMNGGLDTLAGCRSPLHGAPPTLIGTPSRPDELDAIVTTVREWLNHGVPAGHIGICARSKAYADTTVTALTHAGIQAVSLTRRPSPDAVSVGTMHRMKGLEFANMVVTGVGAQHVPSPKALTPAADDPVSHNYDLQRERCLLFVACTRAREQLVVTWSGDPSPLLPDAA